MEIVKDFGILTSISWNSNEWKDDPTEPDLKQSQYGFVIENDHAHEALNFGHNLYPAESDGTYIAYTPKFNRLPDPERSEYVQIVFFISTDYNTHSKKIVGCYGFPDIGEFNREAEHEKFETYDYGNVRSHVKNIIYFDVPIEINDHVVQKFALLPPERKIANQGFNYLDSDNVFKILDLAHQANYENKALKNLIASLKQLANYTADEIDLREYYNILKNNTADTLSKIQQLEKRMKNATPEVQFRVSKYIERGAIATKVKELNGFKCQICESLGENPYSFKKPNGDYYIETHHVKPVSELKKGSLALVNLITACANHHKQLHYGDSEVLEDNDDRFIFRLDSKEVEVKKIVL